MQEAICYMHHRTLEAAGRAAGCRMLRRLSQELHVTAPWRLARSPACRLLNTPDLVHDSSSVLIKVSQNDVLPADQIANNGPWAKAHISCTTC